MLNDQTNGITGPKGKRQVQLIRSLVDQQRLKRGLLIDRQFPGQQWSRAINFLLLLLKQLKFKDYPPLYLEYSLF